MVEVTLSEFCDDDCISLVGRLCKRLKHLKIVIKPESFLEQQLTDDGFLDLIDSQEKCPSLTRLDLSDCHSSGVTAKTVMSLDKIPSLARVHLRSGHFSWLQLTVRLPRQVVNRNRHVRVLEVELSPYQEEVDTFLPRSTQYLLN